MKNDDAKDFEVVGGGATVVVKQGSVKGSRDAVIQVTIEGKTVELCARVASEYHDNNDQEYGVVKVAVTETNGFGPRQDTMGGKHGVHHWGDQH